MTNLLLFLILLMIVLVVCPDLLMTVLSVGTVIVVLTTFFAFAGWPWFWVISALWVFDQMVSAWDDRNKQKENPES